MTRSTLTFTELAELLNLDESIMKPLMHSLSCGKYKIINRIPAGDKVNTTDTFVANAKFSLAICVRFASQWHR
jgi:cullin 1